MWGRTFKLKSLLKTDENGSYYVYDIEPGTINSKQWCDIAAEWAKKCKVQPAKIEEVGGFEDVTGQF